MTVSVRSSLSGRDDAETPGLSSLIEDRVAPRGDVNHSIEEFDPGSD